MYCVYGCVLSFTHTYTHKSRIRRYARQEYNENKFFCWKSKAKIEIFTPLIHTHVQVLHNKYAQIYINLNTHKNTHTHIHNKYSYPTSSHIHMWTHPFFFGREASPLFWLGARLFDQLNGRPKVTGVVQLFFLVPLHFLSFLGSQNPANLSHITHFTHSLTPPATNKWETIWGKRIGRSALNSFNLRSIELGANCFCYIFRTNSMDFSVIGFGWKHQIHQQNFYQIHASNGGEDACGRLYFSERRRKKERRREKERRG